MNAEALQRQLAEIAEMPLLEREPALSELRDNCRAVGFPQPLTVLRAALKTLIKARDENEANELIETDIIDPMNDEFFVIELSGKVRIGHWAEEPTGRKCRDGTAETRQVLSLMTRADFLTFVENRTVGGPNGNIPAGPHWLAHPDRRQYAGTVMVPPPGAVPEGMLNLWQGYGVERKEGDCAPILDHILNVLCNGDGAMNEYILDWIAMKVQQPGRVMGTMPVFISAQGAGKGIIFDDLLMRIFGQHAAVIEDSDQLVGKFNKHLLDACYIFADECFFVGDKRAAQKMKRRITGKTLMLEAKGVDSVTVLSHLGVITATNEAHAINVEVKERRYIIQRCSDARRGDRKYFERLAQHIEGNGAAHFLDKMLTRDVRKFDPEHDRPLTDETIAQREMSLHGVHRWWQEAVDNKTFPVSMAEVSLLPSEGATKLASWADTSIRVSKQSLRDDYAEWARKNAGEIFHDNKMRMFWMRLREIAIIESEDGDNNDRKVTFAALPIQINGLESFLCSR
ncbi:primase-helicase family protein [Aliiroseovarius sp. KMU-71]|uniref:primase-helicase family protein n=1 Tax=Aliiroseovarius sp. KMU-71 TaxID=3453123 RepID=UPI003F452DDA